MSNLTIDVQDIIHKVRYKDLAVSCPVTECFFELSQEEQMERYQIIFSAFHDACEHLSALDYLLSMYNE